MVRVKALDNFSLDLREGDRVGLVGHNGSGKSTLLRVLAGIIHPQRGRVRVRGRVIPLIERGLGINQELTGRQNITLPLLLLGATRSEVRNALQDIPEWTGLGEFIDLPVRTYSEGMRARLMFGISTAIKGDILLLDEWLGAGDAQFISAASERMNHLLASAGIMVVASHSVEIVERFCNKAIWMEKGEIVAIGPPAQVLDHYAKGYRPPEAEIIEMQKDDSSMIGFRSAAGG